MDTPWRRNSGLPGWSPQRGGHMHLRSCIQSAMGHCIPILWSCVITWHPRHVYPVRATYGRRVWHGPAPFPCFLPLVSACHLPILSSAPHPRAPFQIDTGRVAQYRVVFPPHSFLLSTYYISNVGEWVKTQEDMAPALTTSMWESHINMPPHTLHTHALQPAGSATKAA